MKISTILDHIDNGHMALPEFQRGYVWNRDQVRHLFDSLYQRHPVGGLLVWATESRSAEYRGSEKLADGVVKLLLDGQQRITTLYGVIRGKSPSFFDGNSQAFTGLRFHLENQVFSFYQPIKMKDDPLWIDVTELMKLGSSEFGRYASVWMSDPALVSRVGEYVSRLSLLLTITEIDLHIEEITDPKKSIDTVVDIFNRINSGGTKLSKGNLALAKICSVWPGARDAMKSNLKEWESANYFFNLDWLLRSVNTVLTGEAKFQFLHDRNAEEIQNGLKRATKHINNCINLIADRLGLDHDRVLFGRYAFPVLVRYLDLRDGPMSEQERDKLLFWFLQAGMWGRFSGNTETSIDQDLAVLDGNEDSIDRLLEQLRLTRGSLQVEPSNFAGWSLGARFYPVLYLMTRMSESKDWGTGVTLKSSLLGKMSKLEVHHIFPKSRLYNYKNRSFHRSEVNAIANFCFLTKDTNLIIGDRLPEEYFPEIERNHAGALASQWIPEDSELWKIENFNEFLEERQQLLAMEFNRLLTKLIHGDSRWLKGAATAVESVPVATADSFAGDEEELLRELNNWIEEQGLPSGNIAYDLADSTTGQQKAVIDLAWPLGFQEELTQPVAVILNGVSESVAAASQAGFRCFLSVDDLKNYVETEISVQEAA